MRSSQICFRFYTVMKSLPKLSRELLSWLGAAHATACWSAESLHGFVTGLFIPGESSCSSFHFWPPICLFRDIGKIVCSSSSQEGTHGLLCDRLFSGCYCSLKTYPFAFSSKGEQLVSHCQAVLLSSPNSAFLIG